MCNNKSLRAADTKQEAIINSYVVNAYFTPNYKSVEYVDDANRQCKGIDVIVDDMKIDLKAQSSARYINNPTDTFILEVSFLDRNKNEYCGWFLDDSLKTTHYGFVWIRDADVDENIRINKESDIHNIELMLVDKKALHDYILSKVTKEKLLSLAQDMRRTDTRTTWVDSEIKLSCNNVLYEKPVTIVVKKWLLKKFSVGHIIIRDKEVRGIA